MQAIRARRTVREKPRFGARLDPRHPLTPSILGAWTFSEGGGILVRDGVSGGIATASGGPTWTQGTTQSALLFDGSDDYIPTTNINPSYITILTRARADGTSGSGGGFLVATNYDGVSVPFSLNTREHFLYGGFGFYDGSWNHSGTGGHWEGTGWHDFTGTFDGSNSRFFVDSVQVEYQPISERTLPTANTNPVDIGRYGQDNLYFNGAIEYVYILNRALSIDEVRAFHADPYAPFATPTWRRYYIPASAGGITGTGTLTIAAPVLAASGTFAPLTPSAPILPPAYRHQALLGR